MDGISRLSSGPNVQNRVFELSSFGLTGHRTFIPGAAKPLKRSGVVYRILCKLQSREIIVESHLERPGVIPETSGNLDLHGYFQSLMYFEGHQAQVKGLLLKNFNPSPQFMRLRNELSARSWIAVHVRLTDFLTTDTMEVLPPDYYRQALAIAKNEAKSASVVVFSDDPMEAKNIVPEADYVLGPSDLYRAADTMLLMGEASANIFANSSLSWWSGFLSKKEGTLKIFPSLWQKSSPTPREGFLLPEWQTI